MKMEQLMNQDHEQRHDEVHYYAIELDVKLDKHEKI
jgi:predicted metal-dependent hydrolase